MSIHLVQIHYSAAKNRKNSLKIQKTLFHLDLERYQDVTDKRHKTDTKTKLP